MTSDLFSTLKNIPMAYYSRVVPVKANDAYTSSPHIMQHAYSAFKKGVQFSAALALMEMFYTVRKLSQLRYISALLALIFDPDILETSSERRLYLMESSIFIIDRRTIVKNMNRPKQDK